jgi:hypothetical protein
MRVGNLFDPNSNPDQHQNGNSDPDRHQDVPNLQHWGVGWLSSKYADGVANRSSYLVHRDPVGRGCSG